MIHLLAGIALARVEDVAAVKSIADAHKKELGFVRTPSLAEAAQDGRLLVAWHRGQIAGFAEVYHRRDRQTTLYAIAVLPDARGMGIGADLIARCRREAREGQKSVLLAKCPEDLPSNSFYAHLGFGRIDVQEGKRRKLNVWAQEV